EWKLVDELGGLDAAAIGALKLAELEGEPELVYPEKEKPLLIELLGEQPGATVGGWVREGIEGAAGPGGLQFRLPCAARRRRAGPPVRETFPGPRPARLAVAVTRRHREEAVTCAHRDERPSRFFRAGRGKTCSRSGRPGASRTSRPRPP